MAKYIRCDKCGELGIEVIGDKEMPCEVCLQLDSEGLEWWKK